jgi:hypothetical protein
VKQANKSCLKGPLLYYDPSFIRDYCWCCRSGGRREDPRASNKARARQGSRKRCRTGCAGC